VSSPQEEKLREAPKWTSFEREQDLRITTFLTASKVKLWKGKGKDEEKVEKILEIVCFEEVVRESRSEEKK
jgi:hypothetical protein